MSRESIGARIVTDGLVLALDGANPKSYPGTGTTWTDLSGNGYTGTLTNGPTFDSGNGGSISFDGVDDYTLLNYSPATTSNISIISWNYISNTSLRGPFVKVGGGGDGYAIGVGGTTFDNSGNRFLGIYSGRVWINTGDNLGTGWVMTSMVLDSSSHSTFYINKINVHSYSSVNPIIPTTNSYIGRHVGDEPFGTRAFAGRISMVLIYNRAITASEIEQNFNATRSRFGI